MSTDKVSLVSSYDDWIVARRNKGRFAVTIVLCSIPLLDSSFVIFCLTRRGTRDFFTMIHTFCIIYILMAIATTFSGYYGIYKKNSLALRSSINLFTVQNILILLISGHLLFLFVKYRNFLSNHHAPQFIVYFEVHRGLGIFLFSLNVVLRIINILLTWYSGELEASFEVLNRVKASKDLSDNAFSDNDQFQIDIKDDFEQIY